jgi:hypothetical protein
MTIRKFTAILAVCLCLIASVSYALVPVAATAVRRFPVMKTEKNFVKLLGLLENNNLKAATEYLKTDGLLMEQGTKVIVEQVGCDGLCLKFKIEGDSSQYWTVSIMDGENVFEYKQ